MLKIAVTGGNGFLGKHVVNELKNKYILSHPTHSEVDLLDIHSIELWLDNVRPDYIIHLAAKVGGIRANQLDPVGFFYDNMQMGLNIIKSSYNFNVKKFICIGTTCSYPSYSVPPFKEEHLWRDYPEETNAPYGIAKRSLWTLLKSYKEQYGMNSIYLIPSNMYGEYDNFDLISSHVIPGMIRRMHESKCKELDTVELWGSGKPTREFLYAGDCAKIIHMCMNNYDSIDPLNIAMDKEISIFQLAQLVAYVVEYDGDVVWNSTMPDGQIRRKLSTDNIKKIIGDFEFTDLYVGLQNTYEWYKENVHKFE